MRVETDKDGFSRLHALPEGTYDFRVTFPNFNPVEGTAIVSKEADAKSLIEIAMEPST